MPGSPETPQNKIQKAKQEKLASKIYTYFADWSKNVPFELHQPIILFTCHKVFNYPDDAIIMKWVSHMSPLLASQFFYVLQILCERFRLQTKPTNLSSPSSDPSAVSRDLFDRLAPLLILRVIPVGSYSNLIEFREFNYLKSAIDERMFALNEFKEIKRVASEIRARFPPETHFRELFEYFLQVDSSNADCLKVCIYCFCNCFLFYPSDPAIQGSLPLLFSKLTAFLLLQPDSDSGKLFFIFIHAPKLIPFIPFPLQVSSEEVFKLQQGSVDCVSMIVQISTQAENKQSLKMILDKICDNDSPIDLALQLTSALIKVIERLGVNQRRFLATTSFPLLFEYLRVNIEKKQFGSKMAGILQVI